MADDTKKWEAAAERLLAALPSPTAQEVMRETAVMLGIPLWMLITGLLQRVYDNGEHTAPVLDPAWTFGNPVDRPTIPESKCSHCGNVFKPRWIGQEFCDAKCGSAAAKSLAERAPAEPQLVRHQVGQEPEGFAKSTISQWEAHGPGAASPQPADLAEETGVVGGESSGAANTIEAIEAEAQAAIRA